MKRIVTRLACATAVLSLLAACGASPRPRAGIAPSAAERPGAAAVDDDAEEEEKGDADGDVEAEDGPAAAEDTGPCPPEMAFVEGRFCVDRYEAALVEIGEGGSETPFPHTMPVDGHVVRAISAPDVFPQGFISEKQAEDACAASGKRLCTHAEWKAACMGPTRSTYPYGQARRPGACHDSGKSAVAAVFGARALTDPVAVRRPAPSAKATAGKPSKVARAEGRRAHVTTGKAAQAVKVRPAGRVARVRPPGKRTKPTVAASGRGKRPTKGSASDPRRAARASSRPVSIEESVWSKLNDPALGRVEGALAKTGSHPECSNEYGVFDMVGNLHEWVATDPSAAHGTFAGGYYLDTSINGEGCNYRTVAHAHDYHDYSTGFRCCSEPRTTDRAPE